MDVLGSYLKITMKLNFQAVKTKIQYGLIQNQLDIFGFVKIQLNYTNIKKIKPYFLVTSLKQQYPFWGSQGF
jgi:hypothetical protein